MTKRSTNTNKKRLNKLKSYSIEEDLIIIREIDNATDTESRSDVMKKVQPILGRSFESIRDRYKRFLVYLEDKEIKKLKLLSQEKQKKQCIVFDSDMNYIGSKNMIMDEQEIQRKKQIKKEQKRKIREEKKLLRQQENKQKSRKNRNKRYGWILKKLKDFKDEEYQFTHQKILLKDILDLLIEKKMCTKKQVYKCLNSQKSNQNLKNLLNELGLHQEQFQLN